MPITVSGAGASGGITGAALARAGHDVVLMDRAVPHVEAIPLVTLASREDPR